MTFFAYPISFAHPATPPEPAQLSWTYIYTPAKVFAMDICGEKESSRNGNIFLRAGDVYSFGRRTFIPSDERDLSPEPVRMSHSGWCAGATRASVYVPPERVGGCHSSEWAGLIRADRYERQGETAARIE